MVGTYRERIGTAVEAATPEEALTFGSRILGRRIGIEDFDHFDVFREEQQREPILRAQVKPRVTLSEQELAQVKEIREGRLSKNCRKLLELLDTLTRPS